MIPQVVASERGRAQTDVACCIGVVGLFLEMHKKLNTLERVAIAGDSPVSVRCAGRTVS
jgi:hypothetical protein